MSKIALVVMTILLSNVAMADDFQIKKTEDQQLIQVRDDQHQWTIDVDCRTNLDTEKIVTLDVSKKRVQVGSTIKLSQGNKKQNCKVNQFAVVSLF